ncbi:MAG: ABC transporter permease [Candidatus Thorarchaeota archaeon]
MKKDLNRLLYLIKQELRTSSRSRYVIISFVLMPLIMWGIQGGVQFMVQSGITSGSSGESIYISNLDTSNPNVTLPINFTLPFDFQGITKGTNVTQLNLGVYFIESVKEATKNNDSVLFNMKVVDNLSISEIQSLAEHGKVKYWINITEGFANNYQNFNIATVNMSYLTGGINTGPAVVQSGVTSILAQKPFTIFSVDKLSLLNKPTQLFVSGGGTGFNFGSGLAALIGILIAVVAPAPFVATSFAGEREKKTMEALLALPMSRKTILIGKLIAGMILVSIFAIMNIVGMFLYNRIIGSLPNTSTQSEFSLVIDLNPITIIAITLAMFLSAFVGIGIGISIASLTKDVRTSESIYNTGLMIPSMLIGVIGLAGGTPESYGTAGYLLYLIPWSHTLAIFQKITNLDYYNRISPFGSVYIDLIFHISALVIMIVIILYIASRVFEREGIVS